MKTNKIVKFIRILKKWLTNTNLTKNRPRSYKKTKAISLQNLISFDMAFFEITLLQSIQYCYQIGLNFHQTFSISVLSFQVKHFSCNFQNVLTYY